MALRYNSLTFTAEFITYLQANLNTKIAANNTAYGDTLLVNVTDYIYFADEGIDQLRANACVIYDTPRMTNIESQAQKAAVTRVWRIGIAYADNIRDANLTNLSKILRYEACLQQCVEEFFKRTPHAYPQIQYIAPKTEKDDNNSYRFIIFSLLFTIAGA